jgi:hypothetical protein
MIGLSGGAIGAIDAPTVQAVVAQAKVRVMVGRSQKATRSVPDSSAKVCVANWTSRAYEG